MALIKLFIKGYANYLKSMLEYRPAFFTDMLTNIICYSFMYFGLWILMDKFKLIQGWTMWEVFLIYSLILVSYALCSFFFRTPMFNDIENLVRTGRFDIVLIRPMNALLYTMLGRPTIAYFGHLLVGIVVFSVCFRHLNIDWTFLKVLFLILTIVGAALIYAAMYLITATLSFWIVRMDTILMTFMISAEFIHYPVSIYAKFIQFILTFVLPYAFVNYYPAYYLLGKDTGNLFHPVLQFLTPVVGVILFSLAYWFWTIGINRYESTGS
jgi:ABC-2 type transport system permease protein